MIGAVFLRKALYFCTLWGFWGINDGLDHVAHGIIWVSLVFLLTHRCFPYGFMRLFMGRFAGLARDVGLSTLRLTLGIWDPRASVTSAYEVIEVRHGASQDEIAYIADCITWTPGSMVVCIDALGRLVVHSALIERSRVE